jgi:hypothetical protein
MAKGSHPEEPEGGETRRSSPAVCWRHAYLRADRHRLSYIAGILASLREEVCRVAWNAQATITVASEHACTTPIASLYDLPLSTNHTTKFPANNLIYQGVQASIAHEPGSMLESKVGIPSR